MPMNFLFELVLVGVGVIAGAFILWHLASDGRPKE